MILRLALVVTLLSVFHGVALGSLQVFINEFHYDDTGTDVNEFIEIAGPAGTDLGGWRLVLYNGATGNFYDDDAFMAGTTIPDLMGSGFGTVTRTYGVNGIQNGNSANTEPDGIALVDNMGSVIQFLSYEGSFSATNGPAMGLTSTDIGIAESGSTPDFSSLQLTGTGTVYEDFTWSGPMPDTAAQFNTNQTFAAIPEPASLFVWGGVGLLGLATVALKKKDA